MKKLQTTTTIGGMGLTGSISNLIDLFEGVQVQQFPQAFMAMDLGELLLSFFGILISGYAVFHNEDAACDPKEKSS